jgi:anti-sigma regulatory factor (Ser/Thr protein kinase)
MGSVAGADSANGRELARIDFGPDDLQRVRALVRQVSTDHVPHRASDVVLAVHEVAVNSVVHGGGRGTLSVAHTGAELIFDVQDDDGGTSKPLVRHPDSAATSGRGLWIAQRLTDDLTIEPAPPRTTVRLHVRVADGQD